MKANLCSYTLPHTHHTWIRYQHNHHYMIYTLTLLPSSLKQIWEVLEPGLCQSGYSWSNHHKRDSKIIRSKISYSLIEPQSLPCTLHYRHEFHELAFHPHPTFAALLVGSAFSFQSKVWGGAFFQETDKVLKLLPVFTEEFSGWRLVTLS